jgi:hypothetical protein
MNFISRKEVHLHFSQKTELITPSRLTGQDAHFSLLKFQKTASQNTRIPLPGLAF